MRVKAIMLVSLFFAALIAVRLFTVQILAHDQYAELARSQYEILQDLVPTRGDVLIEDPASPDGYYTLASNKELFLLYAVPRDLEDIGETAAKIESVTGMQKDEIIGKLSVDRNDPYEPIMHKLDKGQADRIKEMNIPGISVQSESVRFYPNGTLASHILGYVGYDQNNQISGIGGIEGYYNDVIGGEMGKLEIEKDALGQWIPVGKKSLVPAQNGVDVVLTIDRTIQYKTEELLEEAVDNSDALGGSVIVMDPETGEILSMASYPDFDPNKYNEVDNINVFNNKAISDLYEPGSTFKVIQVAIGIDTVKISPETTYEDTGSLTIGGYTIYNYENKAYGTLTVTQAIEKSDNVVMAQIARFLGAKTIYDYLLKFRFDELTGIDLDKESQNKLRDPDKWKEIDIATSGFGQGVTVTPIQLLTAISSIANNGNMMKPYVVKKVIKTDGTIEEKSPELLAQPISPSTASIMSSMLRSSVEKGFAKPADVNGYKIAGKTGTAQVVLEGQKVYNSSKRIVSFIGYPYENPSFIVLVKIDHVSGESASGVTIAVPLFKKLAEFIFTYKGIPPSE